LAQPTTGGLFGQPTQTVGGGGLFGSTTPAASGGLFGGGATNAFGAAQPAVSAGGSHLTTQYI